MAIPFRGLARGLLLAVVPFSAVPVYAQNAASISPDSVATEFQAAFQAMAWRAAAHRMHPEGLQRFHDVIDIMLDADQSGAVREALFEGMSQDQYRQLSSRNVFILVMDRMMDEMRGLLHALVVRDVEVMGAVLEPPDLAHAVYRSEAQLSGAVPQMRVMTLKMSPEGWRVLETPELDVLREAVKGFSRRERPPPDDQPAGSKSQPSDSIP